MTTQAKLLVAAAMLSLTATGAIGQDASSGDAAAGEIVFRKCMTCHRIGPGATNLVGPQQNGLIGRHAGTVPGFAYSPLNKAAGENGLVWTDANIYDYLVDPNVFLKKYLTDKGKPELAVGVTRMAFKLPSEKERRDVIAYLKKFSDAK
jgi:cytochrome c